MRLDELYPNAADLDKFLWEMANLSQKSTGIKDVIIWVSSAQDGAKRHGPRVKVSAHLSQKANPDDLFVMTIQDNPQIVAGESCLPNDTLEDVKAWISLNKELLLQYWNNQLLTDDLLELIIKL